MKKHFLFHIKDGSTFEEALSELSSLKLYDHYFNEDVESKCKSIGAFAKKKESISKEFLHIDYIEESLCIEIDWQKQWETFSPYYKNGKVRIPLKKFADTKKILTLLPGPGFGDLSHPTTELMLEIVAQKVKGKYILDIGCGSGILGLSALLFGAKELIGIDIDPKAIAHSKKNAKLNKLQDKSLFKKALNPSDLSQKKFLVFMNMTFLEQKAVWDIFKDFKKNFSFVMTSGILRSQKKRYLNFMKEQGLELIEEFLKDKWHAFIFIAKKPKKSLTGKTKY